MPALRALRQDVLLWAALAIAAALGLAQVRDIGLTWDEPLFYDYAETIGSAYSIESRLTGSLDLERAYGPPDHARYGPAYLLLARPMADLLRTAGLDRPAAWHSVNFLLYLVGTATVYFLCLRWVGRLPALAAALLFLTQPVLWGHAFMNPKDMPFMVFFGLSVVLGFRMVDRLPAARKAATIDHERREGPGPPPTEDARRSHSKSQGILATILATAVPGMVLGLTTAIRVIGPFAGVLVLADYFLEGRRRVLPVVCYSVIAAVVAFAAWPYLWSSPIDRFIEVLSHMAHNPPVLPVLFNGVLLPSDKLPAAYLPTLLTLTLTLPAIVLSLAGFFIALRRIRSGQRGAIALALTLLWFAIPLAGVVLLRPTMYDGFRHFLFILPPIFVAAGLAIAAIMERVRSGWLRGIFAVVILIPGIVGIVRLHPYGYAYFNELAGGPAGASRRYESDYWLMCYEEGIEAANRMAEGSQTVFVFVAPEVAEAYAGPHLTIRKFEAADDQTTPGDWILMTTRNNADRRSHVDDTTLYSIGRLGATYCELREVQAGPAE